MTIYLLGASNPETVRVVRAVERVTANVVFAGFLDNDRHKHGTRFWGFPVLGGIERVPELAGADTGFVNLITGSTAVRHETTLAIKRAGGRMVNLIHPNVDLTMVHLGEGLYVQEAVILQAAVSLGDNTSIHMGALIGHETVVGESVFIAHGVSVSGCCRIGDGTFVGTNASILPRRSIGRWATIGAGAVVTKDVPDHAVVVGNPGKIIKYSAPSAPNETGASRHPRSSD
ncbi:MAG: transferase [Acidobacteriota bacterium]|nr:transferase [Acidobacteriota bacterium]